MSRLFLTAIFGASVVLMTFSAVAGSFQVNPVILTLDPNKATAAVTIRNDEDAPVSIRIIAYKWHQENGADVYTETSELVASPPIFTIPGRGTQVVRLGFHSRGAEPAAAYRIFVDEIPRPTEDGKGVRVALRFNIPLYMQADRNSEAVLRWTAWRDHEGRLILEGNNVGTRHERVLEIVAMNAEGTAVRLSDRPGVVLPGGALRWRAETVPATAPGSPLRLSVRTSSGEIRSDVVLQSR